MGAGMDVSLGMGMRSNLLMLQGTQAKISASQDRLATGKRINTALENPPAFFAAKNLEDRANDLMALKDAMGQAISTVKAADSGLQTIGRLVEQAKGLTTAALSALGDDEAGKMSRRELARQYDALLTQIDKVAVDSNYGGKNLINSAPVDFLASTSSKAEASAIHGIRKVDVTNAQDVENYKLRIYGDGEIRASEDGLRSVDDELGLGNFRMFGFNSLTDGSFDDAKLTLRKQGGAKATLLIQEGAETDTIEIDLSMADGPSSTRTYRREFQTGAWVAFTYDVADLAKRAKEEPLVEVAVPKDINLTMEVTTGAGAIASRTVNGGDRAQSLKAGENTFPFDDGTVRVTIDPTVLQQASSYTERLAFDGGLSAALSNFKVSNRAVDGSFDIHYEEGWQYGVVFLQKAGRLSGTNYDYTGNTITYPAQSQNYSFGFTDGLSGQLSGNVDFGKFANNTSSGIRIQQQNPAFGLSVIPMFGTWSNDDLAVGWSGFSTNTAVTVDVGADDSAGAGKRNVTITDLTGGTAAITVDNTANTASESFEFRLEGGSNNGTVGYIYAPTGPTQQIIRVAAVGDAIFPDLNNSGPASLSDADYSAVSGVKYNGVLSVTVGADDSGGAGYRSVTVDVSASGIASVPNNFTVTNAAVNDQAFELTTGPYAGMSFRMDFATGAGSSQFNVTPASTGGGGPTTVLYRAARTGETAQIDVQQQTRCAQGDDLIVQLGQQPTETFTVEAQNVTTRGAGLAIDRSLNEWRSRDDVERAATDLDGATQKLRAIGAELSTGLNIITTRENFTNEFSDVLVEGSNKLVLIDQNEEGANLLMLQTRLQLGTISLSLAAQSQQAVLRLFG